jgi:hypothetical protein
MHAINAVTCSNPEKYVLREIIQTQTQDRYFIYEIPKIGKFIDRR